MGPENSGNEKQLDKSEARNEAIKLQDFLYGWASPHLRSHKGFASEKYNHYDKVREEILRLRPIIDQLPKKQPERKARLDSLIFENYPSILVNAWNENLRDKNPISPEYQKFSDYSRPLFEETEKNFFFISNKLSKGTAKFSAPSYFYMPLAGELYNRTSGKQYLSPQELKYNFDDGLRGKKILEIAPGPGWFMKVLKDSGADIQGIDADISNNYIARAWGLNIHKGDANHLTDSIEGQFDIIISNNFITSSIVDELEAKNILSQSLQKLKPGGISIHSTQYYKIPYELWAITRIISNPDKLDKLVPLLENPPKEETFVSYDFPVLTDNDIESFGVEDFHSANENGHHVFSFKKPA